MSKKFFYWPGSLVCCLMAFCFYFSKPSYASLIRMQKIEVLADDEFIFEIDDNGWRYCRCHRKDGCFGGNVISLRPLCHKEQVYNPDGTLNDFSCTDYHTECANYDE